MALTRPGRRTFQMSTGAVQSQSHRAGIASILHVVGVVPNRIEVGAVQSMAPHASPIRRSKSSSWRAVRLLHSVPRRALRGPPRRRSDASQRRRCWDRAGHVDRVRGLDPARCLVVPVDVGKRSALAMVADHHGEVVGDPVEFALARGACTVSTHAAGLAVTGRGGTPTVPAVTTVAARDPMKRQPPTPRSGQGIPARKGGEGRKSRPSEMCSLAGGCAAARQPICVGHENAAGLAGVWSPPQNCRDAGGETGVGRGCVAPDVECRGRVRWVFVLDNRRESNVHRLRSGDGRCALHGHHACVRAALDPVDDT